MSAEPNNVLVKCSFCAKSNEQVKKVIAGPGVYICDECIGLCNNVLAAEAEVAEEVTAQRRQRFAQPTAEDLLVRIRGTVRTKAGMEADLRRWIAQATTELGIEWDVVALELGVTSDEARSLYGSPDRP